MATNAATPTPAQVQTVIAALQAVIAAASAELSNPETTRAVQAADRSIITTAQAEILRQQAALTQATPTVYTVKERDTIFGIAERLLGDKLAYRQLQQANGLSFIALSPGQHLVIPTV